MQSSTWTDAVARPGVYTRNADALSRRRERMRRLRFTAKLHAGLDMEFGEAGMARRRTHFERAAADPSLRAHAFAVMAGPESVPESIFTEANRARVLGLATAS